MHQLQGIGAVTVNEMHTQLILKKEVRRALHYLEKFSHVHVFFAEKAEHKWNMKTQIFSINRVEMNKGIVLLDEALSDQVDDQEERILLDIKPYFPCEDAVRPEYLKKIVTTTDEYGEQEYPKAFELICTDEASKQFEIEQAGIIRNSHGKTYLQFQETLPDISTNHIKIIWLFNKFEDKRYRRAVECKPPYGDVKKMGIFATRSPVRPNPVAMTIAYVEKVDDEYKRIYISGIESFDKTPFLGVCDYHADYDLIENVSVPEWIEHWPKWFPEPDDAKLQITPDVATDINLDEWLKQNPKTDTVHVLSKLQDVEGTGHSDGIYIQGARENNLKGLTVTIPYTQITAVVGVSGSGKSSLVRDTLYAECKRRMEYLCNDRHLLQKPNVETVSGCIPAVMISQNGLRGNSQSTIGTYTSAYDYLRIIYASIGTRHSTKCNYPLFKLTPSSFSYLDPESRCPVCNGTGYVVTVDEEKLIEHPEKSVLEGASSFWGKLKTFQENSNANWMKGQVFGLAEKKGVDLSLSWNELPEEFREQLLYGTGEEIVKFHYDNKKNGRTGEIERPVEGLCHILERLYEENPTAQSVLKYFSTKKCSECDGERLSQDGRNVTVASFRYPQAAAFTFDELAKWCNGLIGVLSEKEVSMIESPLQKIYELTQAAELLGISYLSLSRGTQTVSGGEGQRIKLLAAMLNHMKGLLYVFDEPSKGLHPKDYERVWNMFLSLQAQGNTIVMVEHNEDMIRRADHIIEIGPGAGELGGKLCAEGSLSQMLEHKESQLSHYLCDEQLHRIRPQIRLDDHTMLTLKDLKCHNLKNISISFPKQALTCICGVSGSGKSSLMKGEMFTRYQKSKVFSEVILVDQMPLGKNSRSVLATYVGIMDEIRQIMATRTQAVALSYDEKFFSFNSENGQCPECKGEGRIKLKYLEDAYITCSTCHGSRYQKQILSCTYQEKNIAQILGMTVSEAICFFREHKEIIKSLEIIQSVGLGYLKLSQCTTELSGGEASRLKLSKQLMSKKSQNSLYLFDEPTTGLHFSDIELILKLIQKLIDDGNTVVAIEHNKQFVQNSDWMIELGPFAGEAGGSLCYQGTGNEKD